MAGTTRRSISVKGSTYARLKKRCDEIGSSVSGYLETLIDADLSRKGVPPWEGPLPSYPNRREASKEDLEAASQHFSF